MYLLLAALLGFSASDVDNKAQTVWPSATAVSTTLSERMAPLGPLVGEWRGSGWMLLPDGKREQFESLERVTLRLGGHALLVEGRHHAVGDPSRIVHDAMAMVVWDARSKALRFRTALASGMGGDFPMQVSPGRFAWQMDTPQGQISYVAEFTSNRWTERGVHKLANGKEMPFFEMSLTRR